METIKPTSSKLQVPVSAEGAMERAPRATGIAPSAGGRQLIPSPDPEVPEIKPRRKFTAKYKLEILEQVDQCKQPGELGELLRREGLYSSNLSTWKRQKEKGLLKALAPQKRGRKRSEKNPLTSKVAQLEKENRRLEQKLKRAELIIEAQKKMAEILGITQNLTEDDENR